MTNIWQEGFVRNWSTSPPPLTRKKICIATDGIANLISMGMIVEEGYRFTMDSDVENAINVYNEDGSYIKFICV